ncbi:MAG TPA: hypothetical protein VHT50_18440 [Mycobacterium sp.]|nr:hypothetical protein [Mycobacterium sp.]
MAFDRAAHRCGAVLDKMYVAGRLPPFGKHHATGHFVSSSVGGKELDFVGEQSAIRGRPAGAGSVDRG